MSSVDDLITKYTDDDGGIPFERVQLASACLSTPSGSPMCRAANRPQLLRYLLLGSAPINVPYSFLDDNDDDDATKRKKQSAKEELKPADAAKIEEQVAFAMDVINAELSSSSSSNGDIPVPDKEELLGLLRYFVAHCGAEALPHMGRFLAPFSIAIARTGESDYGLLYSLLHKFVDRWQPAVDTLETYKAPFSELMRLLLQYHDPLLSLHFDHQNIQIGEFILKWLVTMFTPSTATAPTGTFLDALNMWEWLLAYDRRELPVYVALSLLMDQRSLLMKIQGKPALCGAFDSFRFATITPNSGNKELMLNAMLLHKKTPTSARAAILKFMFNSGTGHSAVIPDSPTTPTGSSSSLMADATEASAEELATRYLSFCALPIEAQELVNTFAVHQPGQQRPSYLKYVVLDCRSENSFNYARLPTAMHVGDTIGFDPQLMETMIEKFKTVKGSHLVILGTGKALVEEQNLIKIITLQFVQAGFPYIAVVENGFKGCIPFIKAGKIEYVRSSTAPLKKKTADGSTQPKTAKHADPNAVGNNSGATKEKLKEAAEQSKEKLSSAGRWGLGFMKNVVSKTQKTFEHLKDPYGRDKAAGEEDSTTASHESSAPGTPVAPNAAKSNSDAKVATTGRVPSTSPEPTPPTANAAPLQTSAKKPQQAKAGSSAARGVVSPTTKNGPPPTGEAAFTFGGDDSDDDDLGLITDIAPTAAVPAEETAKLEEESAAPEVAETEKEPAVDDQKPAAPAPTAETEAPPASAEPEAEKTPTKQTNAEPIAPTSSSNTAKKDDIDDFFDDLPTPTTAVATTPADKKTSAVVTGSSTAAKSTASSGATPHPFDEIFGDDF